MVCAIVQTGTVGPNTHKSAVFVLTSLDHSNLHKPVVPTVILASIIKLPQTPSKNVHHLCLRVWFRFQTRRRAGLQNGCASMVMLGECMRQK